MKFTANLLVGLFTTVLADKCGDKPTFSSITPSPSEVHKAAATAHSESFKGSQYVQGKVFDRIFVAFLENTDYDKAVGEEHLKKLAKQGVTLSNYFAVTHPSQPNYLASVAGDYFGMDDDEYCFVPKHIFSVADLLDDKGITWAEYQEDMPYTGYRGFEWKNQETEANDYVRKHNPLVMMENVETDKNSVQRIKNFTEFKHDLADNALPQYAFITPNMTSDGHDSTIRVAGKFSYDFFNPLLQDEYFTKNTLVVLTFDENETYEDKNRVAAFLLGDIPEELKGTEDDTFYNHYSILATIQNNWDLANLGRNDCGANVFDIVADKTGHKNKKVDTTHMYNNESVPGPLSCSKMDFESPDLKCKGAGGPVLQKIVDAWS